MLQKLLKICIEIKQRDLKLKSKLNRNVHIHIFYKPEAESNYFIINKCNKIRCMYNFNNLLIIAGYSKIYLCHMFLPVFYKLTFMNLFIKFFLPILIIYSIKFINISLTSLQCYFVYRI